MQFLPHDLVLEIINLNFQDLKAFSCSCRSMRSAVLPIISRIRDNYKIAHRAMSQLMGRSEDHLRGTAITGPVGFRAVNLLRGDPSITFWMSVLPDKVNYVTVPLNTAPLPKSTLVKVPSFQLMVAAGNIIGSSALYPPPGMEFRFGEKQVDSLIVPECAAAYQVSAHQLLALSQSLALYPKVWLLPDVVSIVAQLGALLRQRRVLRSSLVPLLNSLFGHLSED